MSKQDIYELIKKKNIWYEITEHEAVFNMDELSKISLPYPERDAKNLFVRDDKKEQYYLITVKGDKKVDLKKFKNDNGTRHLSFASPSELYDFMNLTPGSVSPFGLLNDKNLRVNFFIDKDLLNNDGIIGVHPNDNTATVWLKTEDLLNILEEHNTIVKVVEL